jgi:hypothetical protein
MNDLRFFFQNAHKWKSITSQKYAGRVISKFFVLQFDLNVFKFGTCRTAAVITLHVRSDPRHLIVYGIFDDTVHR